MGAMCATGGRGKAGVPSDGYLQEALRTSPPSAPPATNEVSRAQDPTA